MARKVFISFLGISNYSSICYGKPNDVPTTLVPTRFIQEATIKTYCADFQENDLVCVMTTEQALKNWDDGEHLNRKVNEMEFHHGLKHQLAELDLLCAVVNIMVPDGKTKEEIWKIFEITFNVFQENDLVYFDITHGFRSLPMLNLVLINYAKLLKNITVKGIYYGAFEGKEKKENIEIAPIWDLTDFTKLQDWTNNANIFLKTGNAISLVEQIDNYQYHSIRTHLQYFSEYISGNRGVNIYDGQTMIQLRNALSEEIEPEDPAFKALKPILNRIRTAFDDYQEKSAINGFHAAKWCIQNNLIQQAATIMEEFITTFVLEEIGELKYLQDKDMRTSVSSAMSIAEGEFNFGDISEDDLIEKKRVVKMVYDYPHRKKLGKIAIQLKNSVRNDISHAGFRKNPRAFKEFKTSIQKRYNALKNFLLSNHKIRLQNI
ncbi:MAG: TIGR02221 family CRISPR-associated protein [Bacteroidetes bacterium]|nr:TIGR02221 family CRISPR-associated protein [Bacteroidota bacterium]